MSQVTSVPEGSGSGRIGFIVSECRGEKPWGLEILKGCLWGGDPVLVCWGRPWFYHQKFCIPRPVPNPFLLGPSDLRSGVVQAQRFPDDVISLEPEGGP